MNGLHHFYRSCRGMLSYIRSLLCDCIILNFLLSLAILVCFIYIHKFPLFLKTVSIIKMDDVGWFMDLMYESLSCLQ